MANIDLEKIVGTDQFPNNENDVYALIETIASQRIMAVRSANRLIDATFDYVVDNGQVIQEAVIEMAKSYAYDKSAYDRAPKDPTLHVRYFSDYTERQFEVTVRRDDVRKIIANKGEGVEDVIAQILSTLTSGEGHEDFENVRALILNEYVPDYSTILGGVPKNIKGCIYAARNMYNHLKSDNSDLTEGAGTDDAYISSTPAADIRVAITESLLNLMDVVELANIFNLEKEELFGILVVVPDSDLEDADKYKIVVYDRKAMGRATFIYDFTQEEVAKGRFRNEYLTVSRAYFYNELFKAAALDCTAAATAAIGGLISSPFDITVTVTNGTAGGDNKITLGKKATITITPENGYKVPEDETGITIANANIVADSYVVAEDGVATFEIEDATDDVAISVVCEIIQPAGLTPFDVDDTFSSGVTNIALPIGTNINDILAGLTYSSAGQLPECHLVKCHSGENVRQVVYATELSTGVYALVIATDSGMGGLVYASEAVPEYGIETAGWQVDSNVVVNTSGTIENGDINTTDSGWNGVIVGKVA